MKRLLLLLTTVSLILSSCEENGGLEENNGGTPSIPKIELSQQSIDVGFEADIYAVSVTSPYSWKAVSDSDWIIIESKTGVTGTTELLFKTDRNEEAKERKGSIIVTNSEHNLVSELQIIQKAFVPSSIIIEPKLLTFPAKGDEQEVEIIANFEYEATTTADWITITKRDNGILVKVSVLASLEGRVADVTISSERYNVSNVIKVTQNGLTEEEFANCVIYYTTSNNSILRPYEYYLGAKVVSNSYNNDIGVMVFDAPITSIGCEAFGRYNFLTSITLPNSVTSIEDYAFQYCQQLTSITIPDNVTSIGKYVFNDCYSLTSVAIGRSVTSIGSYVFDGCYNLTSITIPDNVTSIGDYAFNGCYGLTSITIGKGVTSIGSYAFNGCKGELNIDSDALGLYGGKFTKLIIGNSVTSIGDSAFKNCSSLTSITIGNSVISIGDNAFYGCSNTQSITVPNSVTSIGSYAFYECKGILNIDSNALRCSGSKFSRVMIGDSVTSIGDSAFSGCSSLYHVYIPDSVTSIGDSAFSGCRGLDGITIPNSVISIGKQAFSSCNFGGITIPDSVISIGDSAFGGCRNLMNVHCNAITPPQGGSNMFDDSYDLYIYVPETSIDAYKSAQYWKDYRILGR